MNQTLDDKVAIIRESFKAGNAGLMEMSGSLRVDFESGHSVYVYAETYDNSITARFETKEANPENRRHEIAHLRDVLAREICFADISEFQEAQSFNKRHVYTARVDVDGSVFFHETIVIGDDKTVPDEPVSDRKAPPAHPSALAATALEKSSARPQAGNIIREALEQLESIDAKMLRQSLDMMNLKRSSNVRMALNRIFRSAVDAGELMRSIHNESSKLTLQNDHEDLRMIKTIHTDGFLEPVIRLLYADVFGENSDV